MIQERATWDVTWGRCVECPGPVIPNQVHQHVRVRNGPAPVIGGKDKLGRDHWYKISNVAQNAADVWLYAEIGSWGITAEGLVSELSTLNVANITVHLNSPGGDVWDGIAIMNALRDHPAHVTVQVDALAASIASVIAQAGNKIVMGRNSTMMIHNASGYAMGESKDLRKMADLLEATTANIASVYAERAGGTAKQWLKVMDDETWYSAEEAVAAGLADEVAPLPTEREAHHQAAKFDLSIYNHVPAGTVAPLGVQYVGETGPDLVDLPDDFEYPIEWNADAFKTAITDALPEPVTWDPHMFTTAIASVVNNAPVPEPPKPPEPLPVAGFDPTVFAQAMRDVNT